MLNAIAPVTDSLHSNRKLVAGTATIVAGVVVTRRLKLWKKFITDPEAFDAQYPAAA